jgi:hypothetical protein
VLLLLPCTAQPLVSGGSSASVGDFGIRNAVGTAVGAIAAIGLVTAIVIFSRHNITGCVHDADGLKTISDESGKRTYNLSGYAGPAGRRLHLRGIRLKEKDGSRTFSVTGIVKDYGACTT